MSPSLVFLSLLLVLVIFFSWGRFTEIGAGVCMRLVLIWVGIFACGTLLLTLMGLPAGMPG